MIVLIANNWNPYIPWLSGRFCNRVGVMVSQDSRWRKPTECFPYAIDNGRYQSCIKDQPWDDAAFLAMCAKAACQTPKPLFIVVPDVIGNSQQTLSEWAPWYKRLHGFGIPLAFAMQDGMDVKDVPPTADWVFVGGTDDWKWGAVGAICEYFERPRIGGRAKPIHVGRVNTYRRLRACDECGVTSVDGSGWFRQPSHRKPLMHYLEQAAACTISKDRIF